MHVLRETPEFLSTYEIVDVISLQHETLGQCDAFVLAKPLTQAQRDVLHAYTNVRLTSRQYRYAPEIEQEIICLFPDHINTHQ